jgi:hypothetical protein
LPKSTPRLTWRKVSDLVGNTLDHLHTRGRPSWPSSEIAYWAKVTMLMFRRASYAHVSAPLLFIHIQSPLRPSHVLRPLVHSSIIIALRRIKTPAWSSALSHIAHPRRASSPAILATNARTQKSSARPPAHTKATKRAHDRHVARDRVDGFSSFLCLGRPGRQRRKYAACVPGAASRRLSVTRGPPLLVVLAGSGAPVRTGSQRIFCRAAVSPWHPGRAHT